MESIAPLIKIFFAFLVNGFGIVVFISFFYFKMGRKDNEYEKVMKTFGLKPKIEDQNGKKVEKKPSTVLKKSNYILPLFFFTGVCTMISCLFLFPSTLFPELFDEETNIFAQNPFFLGMYFGNLELDWGMLGEPSIKDIQRRSIATLSWTFIGAFLWSSSTLVRRLSKADITPILYYKASFRILFACGVALVFSFLIGPLKLFGGAESSNAFVPALAFVAGILPDSFFNYLLQLLKNIIERNDINTKDLALKKIEGMSLYHRERLLEEGIDNAQNLSQASLTQLMIRTPFEPRQVLDWMGQAKLLCHMKDQIGKAHDVGIRSVYDFVSLAENNARKGRDNMNAMQELGTSTGLATPILAVVSELVNEDQGIRNLKYFMDKLNGKGDKDEAPIQVEEHRHPEEDEIPTSYG